jgi:hypothetical protein
VPFEGNRHRECAGPGSGTEAAEPPRCGSQCYASLVVPSTALPTPHGPPPPGSCFLKVRVAILALPCPHIGEELACHWDHQKKELPNTPKCKDGADSLEAPQASSSIQNAALKTVLTTQSWELILPDTPCQALHRQYVLYSSTVPPSSFYTPGNEARELRYFQDPKRAGGGEMQVIECLHSNFKAMSSNPSTTN